jgi:rubrerythrin
MTHELKTPPRVQLPGDYRYDAVSELTELLWRCSQCGELIHRKEGLPEKCPSCGAPQREFALVEED